MVGRIGKNPLSFADVDEDVEQGTLMRSLGRQRVHSMADR